MEESIIDGYLMWVVFVTNTENVNDLHRVQSKKWGLSLHGARTGVGGKLAESRRVSARTCGHSTVVGICKTFGVDFRLPFPVV